MDARHRPAVSHKPRFLLNHLLLVHTSLTMSANQPSVCLETLTCNHSVDGQFPPPLAREGVSRERRARPLWLPGEEGCVPQLRTERNARAVSDHPRRPPARFPRTDFSAR